MPKRGVRNEDRELTGRVQEDLHDTGRAAPQQDEAEDAPRDAGRTSGGGSLGHKQPRDVAEQTHIRNQPSHQRPNASDEPPA